MSEKQKIFLGCDHAGFSMKKALLHQLSKEFPDLKFDDVGTHSEESADYPKFAGDVAGKVTAGGRGILVCGTGIGMSIAANKVKGIRAVVAWDVTSARLSRQHNDTNVLCLGARLVGPEVALETARVWLSTEFQGGRHAKRVDMIHDLEKEK